MKIYQVGGCVRDKLLGLEPKDIDYVVVGTTPEQMLALGFDQVGADFPVFLHPRTREEYALARTERKVGVGYHGFVTDYHLNVTLEQDLERRDLTINAMAIDMNTNEIIDPYGGRQDLADGVLRHTSEAFAEDPVRVLRTARFYARYTDFTVASSTRLMMGRVMHELKFVPQERIWTEFEKGFLERRPDRMFSVLDEIGAFDFPATPLRPYRFGITQRLSKVLPHHDLVVRFALAGAGFEKDDYKLCRIPTDCAEVSSLFNKHWVDFCEYPTYTKRQRLELLYTWKAFSRLKLLEKICEVLDFYDEAFETIKWLEEDVKRARTVDAAAVAASCKTGAEVKVKLFDARLATL